MIYILDFGSQYSQLIARRVRALGVASKLVPYDYAPEKLKGARGIILSGGPDSVYEKGAASLSPRVFSLGIPVLGICYGMQLMAHVLKGKVERAKTGEYGPATVAIGKKGALLKGLPQSFGVWMSHGDNVVVLPPGFQRTARSPASTEAAVEHPDKKLYGLQFHPEVEHTQYGTEILKNFVFGICKCKASNKLDEFTPHQISTKDYHMDTGAKIKHINQRFGGGFIERKTAEIKKTVGKQGVICATSGGVDSSVAAALVGGAIGKRLTCIFVNSGTLRKNEAKQAVELLRSLGLNVKPVNAEQQFLRALREVSYGETKRKIIGKEFIRVFEKAAKDIRPAPTFLAQGTIHSDVVESARTTTGKKTQTIKSHHNVAGLPKTLHLKLLEPLRDLFKDEVRQVGIKLGLPEHAVWRQPFPGPGLAIRVVGEVTKEKLNIVREADAIVKEEIEKAGLARNFYQYFAILLSEKTVGVTGDQRKYAYPIVVKAVVSSDIMTYDWARLPYDLLAHISNRITSEVPQVARVLYDITPKPPGTTEWE